MFEYSYVTSDWILMDSDENRLAGEAEDDFRQATCVTRTALA